MCCFQSVYWSHLLYIEATATRRLYLPTKSYSFYYCSTKSWPCKNIFNHIYIFNVLVQYYPPILLNLLCRTVSQITDRSESRDKHSRQTVSTLKKSYIRISLKSVTNNFFLGIKDPGVICRFSAIEQSKRLSITL